MRKISLQKIDVADARALQDLLLNFVTLESARLRMERDIEKMFNGILILEIAQVLYMNFRRRIENTPSQKRICTVSISPSEAVILFKVCTDSGMLRDDYTKHVSEKVSSLIHKELYNLINV